jgi:hypothetical protein
MQTREGDDRRPSINVGKDGCHGIRVEVGLARSDEGPSGCGVDLDISHVREALCLEQRFGHELRCDTSNWKGGEPERRDLRWRLGRGRPRKTKKRSGA